MSFSASQNFGPEIDPKALEKSQQSALMEELEKVFDAEAVRHIAEGHGLTAFHTSLGETLKSAGSLFLRYSRSNAKTAHDLAPKFRTVTRAAEIARNFDSELSELDFWDRWQIFKQLQATGHPLTEQLDSHTKTNPLLAGNILIEEIQLILHAITRFETDFFSTLTGNTDGEIDIGLYFFVEVIGTYWQSLTGETVVSKESPNNISPEGLAFMSDCIAPLCTVTEDEIVSVIRSALE